MGSLISIGRLGRVRSLGVLGLAACGVMGAHSQSASATSYTFANLGDATGVNPSFGQGINSVNMTVVGSYGATSMPAFSHGIAASRPKFTPFGSATGWTGTAYGVTNFGYAVGTIYPQDNAQAFWTNVNDLHPAVNLLPNTVTGIEGQMLSSEAYAVSGSNAGFTAVGYYSNGSQNRAYLWTNGNAKLTPLDGTGGGTGLGSDGFGNSTAFGINFSRQVVGQADNSSETTTAFLYSPETSKMYDLGTESGAGNSVAQAINNSGTIVGQSDVILDDGAETQQAFAYTGYNIHDTAVLDNFGSSDTPLDGSFTALGSLDSSDYGTSTALAINDSGVIVGMSSTDEGGTDHAFIYEDGVMTDLNSLVSLPAGWELDSANGIDSNGDITGFADDGTNAYAYLLEAASGSSVPEPASLGLGLVGVSLSLRRRRR